LKESLGSVMKSYWRRDIAMGKEAPPEPEVGLRISVVEMEEGLAQKPRLKKHLLRGIASLFRKTFSRTYDSEDLQELACVRLFRRALYLLTSIVIVSVIAVVFVHPLSSPSLLLSA
jgi:hypothetical protein